MSRNRTFHSFEPLKSNPSLQLQQNHITGPFSFLNPTRASFKFALPQEGGSAPVNGDEDSLDKDQHASDIKFKWRSRDNRKGRHTLAIDPPFNSSAQYLTPDLSSTLGEATRGIIRMVTQYPYWDVSYLVAITFTLGSCVWVINAFFVWLPLVKPNTEFHDEILVGGGVSAFIGATIFEIGSVLLIVEAVNENRAGCFGWALERVIFGNAGDRRHITVRPDKGRCTHHHTNRKNFVGKGSCMVLETRAK